MYKAGQADAKTGSVDTGVSEAGAASAESWQGIENGTRPTETANGVLATENAGASPSTEQQSTAKTEQQGTTTAQKPASVVNAELEAKLAPFGFTTEQRAVADKVAETGDLKQIPGNYDKTTVQKIIQAAEIIKEFKSKNNVDSRQGEGYNGNVGKKISKASPYELTPTHEKTLSNKQFSILKEKIKENGIQEPIKYVEYNGKKYVVDGHHRLLIAKQLRIIEIPIEKVELPYLGYTNIDDLLWFM